jgi:hypothetical protein
MVWIVQFFLIFTISSCNDKNWAKMNFKIPKGYYITDGKISGSNILLSCDHDLGSENERYQMVFSSDFGSTWDSLKVELNWRSRVLSCIGGKAIVELSSRKDFFNNSTNPKRKLVLFDFESKRFSDLHEFQEDESFYRLQGGGDTLSYLYCEEDRKSYKLFSLSNKGEFIESFCTLDSIIYLKDHQLFGLNSNGYWGSVLDKKVYKVFRSSRNHKYNSKIFEEIQSERPLEVFLFNENRIFVMKREEQKVCLYKYNNVSHGFDLILEQPLQENEIANMLFMAKDYYVISIGSIYASRPKRLMQFNFANNKIAEISAACVSMEIWFNGEYFLTHCTGNQLKFHKF